MATTTDSSIPAIILDANGENWSTWQASIRRYAGTHNGLECIQPGFVFPPLANASKTEKALRETAYKISQKIQQTLHSTLRPQFNADDNPSTMLAALNTKFGRRELARRQCVQREFDALRPIDFSDFATTTPICRNLFLRCDLSITLIQKVYDNWHPQLMQLLEQIQ